MDKVWLKHYGQMAREIDPEIYNSLAEFLDEKLELYGGRVAYSSMGAELSYDEINDKSLQFATWLQQNFSQGDRIAVMMPNIMQYPVAIFGILRAGMTVVNVNPLYTSPELIHQLKDSGAVALIFSDTSGKVVAEAVKDVRLTHLICTRIGDYLGVPKSWLVNFIIKYVKKLVPAYSLSAERDFKDIVDSSDSRQYKKPELTGDDIAFLQYTGGTTGVAKGAALTHRNMVANIYQALEFVQTIADKDKQEIIITALPLYHIFSLLANCFVFTAIGAKNVLITNPRDIPGFIKELKKHKFSVITGVNTLFNALLNNPEFSKVDFSNLVLTLGGGMAVQSSTAQKWHEVTRVVLLEAYGLTEASPAVTINPTNLTAYNGSIGIPVPSTDISIRDDADNELEIGMEGELWVKGPQIMQGYWQCPEETAKVLTEDGWLKTGDIATVDADGFVRIVDRKKDMILVSGFNVYPNEIEDVLTSHQEILEAACIGVPDARSGEAVKAFVVLESGSDLNEKAIISYAAQSLTGYKTPDIVQIVSDLPKNNVGKILRRELRYA